MKARYQNCIFCRKELPLESERGRGEHVIPAFIFGSLVIKDVCIECNKKFGSEIDHLILRDPDVINAILELNISDLKDKLIQEGDTIGRDLIDGHKLKFSYDKGKFKQIPQQIDPLGLEIPEENAEEVIIKQYLRRTNQKELDKNDKEGLDSLFECYKNLEVGELISSDEFGVKLVKRQAIIEKTEFRTDSLAGLRLAAKIAYEFCCWFLPTNIIDAIIDDLMYFGSYAFGEAKLDLNRFMRRPTRSILEPGFQHSIILEFDPLPIILDIDLFRSVSFRLLLKATNKIELPGRDGESVKRVGLGFSFIPEKDRSKVCAIWVNDKKDPIVFDCSDL